LTQSNIKKVVDIDMVISTDEEARIQAQLWIDRLNKNNINMRMEAKH
jgi:hypothetical protein